MSHPGPCRNLVVVFGDQLDAGSSALDGFDSDQDLVWMAESAVEAAHVWSNKHRIALFFSSMRHFAEELKREGKPIAYHRMAKEAVSLWEILEGSLSACRPERIICAHPGEYRILQGLKDLSRKAGLELVVRDDRHFLDDPASFVQWAGKRKQVRMEYYYRMMRIRHDILMTGEGKPIGGDWNYDKANRGSFGQKGPTGGFPDSLHFTPDAITREVLDLVESRFHDHPGDLRRFGWPVTRSQALEALDDFIEHRLHSFGNYQDAMWRGQPYLYHSLLSASLNLKLLNPREVIEKAVAAFESGRVPLNSVEGFVRQILGWREYVRGIYWWKMPDYVDLNALEAHEPLPGFYWTGETPYACLADTLGQTLDLGYAHHIQRLMITGLYAMLLGVDPKALHEWYLAVYVDAVEWVELPNTLGMSQFGDGGIMASKPYAASGKYIHKMSNYCQDCPADPAESTGPRACPFTTLYWDFLIRNRERLRDNPRLALQFKNSDRLAGDRQEAISHRAEQVRSDPSGKALF